MTPPNVKHYSTPSPIHPEWSPAFGLRGGFYHFATSRCPHVTEAADVALRGASELWTSAPPPRLSLEALQAHYAASYQSRRPRKVSTAAALSGEACPWYSPRGLRIWAKEAACSARGVHVCEDRHGTRCVCHTRPRSQKNRSRFFKIEPS